MKVSVVIKRSFGYISCKNLFAVLGLFVIIGCAVQSRSSKDTVAAGNVHKDSSYEQLSEKNVAVPQLVSKEVLSSLEKDAVGLEIFEHGSAEQLVVNAHVGPDSFIIDRISNPERIVIDIQTSGSKLNKNFDAAYSNYIEKIRVGSHPDKLRVVMDLQEGRDIRHEVDTESGRLVVMLSGLDLDNDNFPLAIGGAGSEDSNIIAAILPDLESEHELEEVTYIPALADNSAIQNSLPEEAFSIVKNVSLERLGSDGNVLVAEIDEPGAFLLKQTAPSEYVLTLKGTRLKTENVNIVAPPQSGLIRSVRAMEDGEDTILRIFAQPDSSLSARVGSDRVVVSAISAQDQLSFMAQAEPERAIEDFSDEIAKPAAGGRDEVTLEDDLNGDLFEQQLDELASSQFTGRLISLDLQDTDIDNALRIIAEVSNLNIIASDDVTGKVTLRLIDVPWDQALDVILKTNGLDKVREGNVVRIAPVEKLRQEREALKQLRISQEELEPLQVKYIRISYAKASELKPLVETVVSERGIVTYDERSNQIIVKDISAGLKNVSELVSRVDLRTPQVLLETQIVEANRNINRDLGAELGFQYVQSVETGNATGKNFPNSVNIGGSGDGGNFSSFPVSSESAISFLFGSADGSKNLGLRLSQLESEGRARIVSRPAVATTNNKQAVIKSVEKIRIKTPQGGLSVATGQGASAQGASAVATEAVEIGIVLEVTPQASPDYYVLLDINAKSSTLGVEVVDGIPSEIERSATSTVLVSSGQTFAMGGIYKLTDRDTISGVPFLKDIPFLGHFFRSMTTRNSDEELLFFITPRIVEGSFDDATMRFSS